MAKSTQPVVPEPLAAGARGHAGQPRRHEAHWPGSKWGARARARYSVTTATIAGGVVRARARERVLSTREMIAHHLVLAPLANGHRRRRQRQWRTAVFYRKTRRRLPRTVTTIRSLIEREEGSRRLASSPSSRSDARERSGQPEVAGIDGEAARCRCGRSTMATRLGRPNKHGSAET